MVTDVDLLANAKSRFQEAKVLHDNAFFDGAFYLCGYALEFVLKRNVIKKMSWMSYPPQGFNKSEAFKTHDLDQLLILSGLYDEIYADTNLLTSWQKASQWNAEVRYNKVGNITEAQSKEIIDAFKVLLNHVSSKHP